MGMDLTLKHLDFSCTQPQKLITLYGGTALFIYLKALFPSRKFC